MMKWLMVIALVLLSTTASADDKRARELFAAGVEAYKAGKFMPAAQAFLEAHKLVDKPALLFSAAQAFRRKFDAERDPTHLRLALRYYETYVDQVKEGGRRYDASRALGELRPLLRDGEGSSEITFPTRISVMAHVEGAVVSIDGGKWLPVPYNGEIAPGKHKVRLRARGYLDAERELVAHPGRTAPVDVHMVGKPAELAIRGADGAQVTIDGKPIGEAPLSQALKVKPGRHFVAVTQTGHRPYAEEINFEYGTRAEVDVDLPLTNQRRLAWGVIATGGASFIGAGVLVGLAFAEDHAAANLQRQKETGSISEQQRIEFNDTVARRDNFRTASGIVAGAGAGLMLTGLLLFIFDEPAVIGERAPDADEVAPKAPIEIDLMGGGVSVTARF